MPPYTRAQRTKREVVRAEQSEAQRTEAVRRREEEEKEEEIEAQEHSEDDHTEEKAEEEEEKQSKRELKKKVQNQKKEKKENVNTKPELVEGVSFDQGLSATGKKVELVQRVIDHLNSGDHSASSDSEAEVEEEEEEEEEAVEHKTATKKRGQESDVGDVEESDQDESEAQTSDDEDFEDEDDEEYEYDAYEEDPDLRKLLRRLGDFCQERNPGLAMKEINRFEHELQTKLGKHIRIPHELRQLYRFSNGMRLDCDIRILPLADAMKAECRDHDEVDLEDDCSAMRHPAWIPFAEDGDYDVYLINTNLQSQTFGEIMLWTLNCGEEEDSARSLYYYLSSIRARCVA